MASELKPPARDEKAWQQTLESPWFQAVARLDDIITHGTHSYFRLSGAKTLHLPVTTGAISSPMGRGSDSKPVSVDLDGEQTYLADSMQFYLEYACRLFGSDSYYVMPCFRGEDADTTHLRQFYHAEAEVHGDLDAAMQAAEGLLKHLCRSLLDDARETLGMFGSDSLERVETLASWPGAFERVTFDQALRALKVDKFPSGNEPGTSNLSRDMERRLIELFGPFVWITHWDHLSVPFYQAVDESDPSKALNADLLLGPGEVVGAGQRHATKSHAESALLAHEVSVDSYAWYLGMKEVAPLLTSGFGVGLERFLMYVTGHDDVRDLQIVPRWPGLQHLW